MIQKKPCWRVLTARKNKFPSKRWGHSAVLLDKFIYIYGGQDKKDQDSSLYKFNCETEQCDTFEFKEFNDRRESHSCCHYGGSLYIYGGCYKQELVNTIFNISLDGHVASVIQQHELFPSRESHVAAIIGEKYLFLYGGTDQNGQDKSDFWFLQLETLKWKVFENVIGTLPPKSGCTLVLIRNIYYLYGGYLGADDYNGEIYSLVFSHNDFSDSTRFPTLTINEVKVNGRKPEPRACQACASYKQQYMISVGGEGYDNIFYNDVWFFDTVRLTWIEIQVSKENVMKPRSNHSLSVYNDKIFVFGGIKGISENNYKIYDEFLTLEIGGLPIQLVESVQLPSSASQFSSSSEVFNQPALISNPQGTLCSMCQLQFSAPVYKPRPTPEIIVKSKLFNTSFETIEKIASIIRNPFDAFGLVLACSRHMASSLHISLSEIATHYSDVFFHQSNEPVDELQSVGFIQKQARIHNSQTILMTLCELRLTQTEFWNMVLDYNFIQFSHSHINNLHFDKEPRCLGSMGYSLKNACLRLGSEVLFSYRSKSSQTYFCLFSKYGIHTLIYEEGKQFDNAAEIISQYLRDFRLKRDQIAMGLSIHISSLKMGADRQSQLFLHGSSTDVFCKIWKGATQINMSLRDYISYYFLEDGSTVYLQGQLMRYSYLLDFEVDSMQSESSLFKRNRLKLCSSQGNVIRVYQGNRYLGEIQKYPHIWGYIELHDTHPLNMTLTKAEDSGEIMREVAALVRIVEESGQKRVARDSIR